MRNVRDNDLLDRRSAAAGAKAALLQAYRSARESAKPTRLARQQEHLALAAAREQRRAARESTRLAEQEQERMRAQTAERQAAASAAADAAARAVVEAREKAEDRISRVIADEAVRKAERDRRYANRRARRG